MKGITHQEDIIIMYFFSYRCVYVSTARIHNYTREKVVEFNTQLELSNILLFSSDKSSTHSRYEHEHIVKLEEIKWK